MNNIAVFMETVRLFESNETLQKLQKKAVDSTYIINEGFLSKKHCCYDNPNISFAESTTLQAAEKLCREGKRTAVLNFANPIEPGGGVLRGANAQEEYLCRASDLYACLSSDKAEVYYSKHKSQFQLQSNRMQENNDEFCFIASDRIIYSKNITVIRRDIINSGYIEQILSDDWYQIDVITCAAPYHRSYGILLPEDRLYDIFCSRIRNILEAAIDNEAEALVLGAFGCGAFRNPPRLVAGAFRNILLEERYRHSFSDVVFAVKKSNGANENAKQFYRSFAAFPEEKSPAVEEKV